MDKRPVCAFIVLTPCVVFRASCYERLITHFENSKVMTCSRKSVLASVESTTEEPLWRRHVNSEGKSFVEDPGPFEGTMFIVLQKECRCFSLVIEVLSTFSMITLSG